MIFQAKIIWETYYFLQFLLGHDSGMVDDIPKFQLIVQFYKDELMAIE